ncbi:E3 ubiquitin-protein ligase RNF8-like isoform X2 [Mercenaria mercenaria]|uniref:E3 ubiquitin-protein ligase RNF8-like isoform X2 n=1 Tax=Mercenaria mercenaria TaxID=6596 RepID=UPI00234E4D12|nr:E3 ubiquitin-protein ligase RNF8-like isoform X2 [Mercenaria mercenaria]
MAERINCLKRLGDNVKKYKLIVLEGKEESLNGVFINDKKLEPMVLYKLQDGDKVQFGVRTSPEAPPEFLFQYYAALKVKHVRKAEDTVDGLKSSGKRRRLDGNEAEEEKPSCSRTGKPTGDSAVTSSQPDLGYDVSPRKRKRPLAGHDSPYEKYRKKMEEQEAQAVEKLAEMESKLKEMQRLLQEKDSAKEEMEQELKEEKQRRENQVKMLEGLKEKEKQMKEELEKKQEELAREKEEMQERMKEELEVKEATLLENLEKQKQALLEEKKKVEEKLKKELESEREKDKQLSEELIQQRQRLEKVIENKEAEQKLLESQLNDTKKEKDRKEEEVLRAKEDVLSNFAELMETELQCSICNELFVRATSLNCSHAFCSLCINQWMKVKKECPQCRAAITTHMHSVVLDSYIEKMVEQFSKEMKTRRQELVVERKKEEAAFNEANKPKPAPAPARGRGRGGRGRGRTRGGLMAAPPALPEPPPPIMISEDEDDSDVDDDDEYNSLSDSDIEGDGDAYYGGYGHCYNCGSRGHWANGCPFR